MKNKYYKTKSYNKKQKNELIRLGTIKIEPTERRNSVIIRNKTRTKREREREKKNSK